MNSVLLFCIVLCSAIQMCFADCDNVQDICPAAPTSKQNIFINGLPCKRPESIAPSDFKSSKLSQPGDTDNFLRSSTTIVTAIDFPGLNTLGLSISRIDLDVDGLVLPRSHPRASEIFFVGTGVVIAGFVDTNNQLFQSFLKEGDVFVVPRGLLHFCLNAGNDAATVYSVLNSQNPGVVNVAGAMFETEPDIINKLVERIKSLSASAIKAMENVTAYEF
ncbi:germin-like protein subfamily 3 member 4 [Ricinus communis]|uniref:Germin-like protein n=1 Tax=Ricinus communis TaxID=3988 RepID=B9RA36_RICCO|nr:germin-like protein subfamily 3 member 4 [Ricinus communis]EEF51663.1 Rhicadhesin receptor precursor, putative [Ricinus communis]|eukprot:XP_002511061.1 germin-like protein subfamily 3 member 4 [Ricinus communis]